MSPLVPLLDLSAKADQGSSFAKKESTLKREKLAKFERVCSEILPKFCYVAGAAVSKAVP